MPRFFLLAASGFDQESLESATSVWGKHCSWSGRYPGQSPKTSPRLTHQLDQQLCVANRVRVSVVIKKNPERMTAVRPLFYFPGVVDEPGLVCRMNHNPGGREAGCIGGGR